jgi:hypothetical protein
MVLECVQWNVQENLKDGHPMKVAYVIPVTCTHQHKTVSLQTIQVNTFVKSPGGGLCCKITVLYVAL